MMVYGYSDDSTGFVALATGSGHVFRAVEARAGRPVIANEMDTAMDAAERVDDAFMDETTCVSTTAPPKVFELNGIPDHASPEALVLVFAATFDAAASLHPNPTPALFQQYVHDDTAAGLQTTLAAPVLPHPANSCTYTTPEGHPYLPPIINGVPAVPLLQDLRARGLHCSLAGEPGTGKTTMAQVAHGDDLVVQGFHGETTVEDVVGRWVPRAGHPGDFRWLDGPLAVAMKEGRPYLANELPRAPRETQAVFLPVMDHQRRLLIEGNPDDTTGQATVINATPGFVVSVDFNPGSWFGLTEALHSRIALPVTVPTDYSVARRLGVPAGLLVGAVLLDSIFFQTTLGYTALEAGLAFLPMAVILIVGTRLGSHLLGHAGPRMVAAGGLLLAAGGAFWLSTAPTDARFATDLLPGLLMMGLGVGLVFVAVSITAMAGIPAQHAGMASGFLMTGHEIGAVLGVAVLAAVAAAHGDLTTSAGVANGFSGGFLAAAGIAAGLAVVAFLFMPAQRATGQGRIHMH